MISESIAVDVSQDWIAACGVQERFMELPTTKAQRLTYNGRCRQMRALGGDCFQVMRLAEDRLAIAVVDASGKGLPAALVITNVQSSLRTAALFAPEDPATVVSAVNRELHACSPADRYATLFYGVFDENTRTLDYVNAGHNPAVVMSPDGTRTWLQACSLPVGLFAETVYRSRTVQLFPGDLILAYTDGLIEATNAAGEEWGVEGLLAAATCRTRKPKTIVEDTFKALDEFSANRQTDDATVLAALVH